VVTAGASDVPVAEETVAGLCEMGCALPSAWHVGVAARRAPPSDCLALALSRRGMAGTV
jgi:hypothetical protein